MVAKKFVIVDDATKNQTNEHHMCCLESHKPYIEVYKTTIQIEFDAHYNAFYDDCHVSKSKLTEFFRKLRCKYGNKMIRFRKWVNPTFTNIPKQNIPVMCNEIYDYLTGCYQNELTK